MKGKKMTEEKKEEAPVEQIKLKAFRGEILKEEMIEVLEKYAREKEEWKELTEGLNLEMIVTNLSMKDFYFQVVVAQKLCGMMVLLMVCL